MQRYGEPARPDAEVEDRRLGRPSELKPGPEVTGIRQGRVKLGERRIRRIRIVSHPGHELKRSYATAWSAISNALSMMAKPSASWSSSIHSGGLVMIVCQRTKV